MRTLILSLSLQLFILNLYGQDQYLLMTRERHRGITHTSLAEVPVAIAIDILDEHLPKPKPVERRIQEGIPVKVISSGSDGREKNKGRLEILNDSAISVGTSIVLINDIDKIFVRTTFSKVSGPVISGGGIAGTIFMVPVFIESITLFEGEALAALAGLFVVPFTAAALAGCAVAAIGGIIYFINGRVFNTWDNWYSSIDGWEIYVADNHSETPPGP